MLYTLRTIAGIALLILAVVGAVLPVLQGWAFFLAAVAVLGPHHPITKWCWSWIKWGREKLNQYGIWKRKDLPPDGPPL
jgi:hypothetical protein